MGVDLSRVLAGDKVLLRDGSKIVVDDRGGNVAPMVLTHYLSVWTNDGRWTENFPDCPFDIVGVIHGPRRSANGATDGSSPHD